MLENPKRRLELRDKCFLYNIKLNEVFFYHCEIDTMETIVKEVISMKELLGITKIITLSMTSCIREGVIAYVEDNKTWNLQVVFSADYFRDFDGVMNLYSSYAKSVEKGYLEEGDEDAVVDIVRHEMFHVFQRVNYSLREWQLKGKSKKNRMMCKSYSEFSVLEEEAEEFKILVSMGMAEEFVEERRMK